MSPPPKSGCARALRALPLVLTGLLAAGCSRAEPARSVVLISIDTLRWDRLGCTGHAAAATPVIDGLARQGTLYQNCVAAAPLTLPSHATILSGLLPIEHGVRDNGLFRFPEEHETLATRLDSLGYDTYAVIAAQPLAPGCGLERGFDVYDYRVEDAPLGGVALAERPADRVTSAALDLLAGHDRERPFFLFVHYFDPHSPYAPPAPFLGQFAHDPYDGEVAFVDREIGRLLSGLRTRGLLADTVIALTADHGESFGEHGEDAHGFFVYDATIRVPLVIVDPAGPPPGVEARQVRHQDLRAFLEARAAGAGFDLTRPAQAGEPALVESLYGAIHCDFAQLRGLRSPAGTKYLESGVEEFYELSAGESENLAAIGDERVAAARRALAAALVAARHTPGVPAGGGLPGYLQTPLEPELIRTRTATENRSYRGATTWEPSIAALQDGVRLLQDGLADAACARLEAGVGGDPQNPALWFWLGRACRAAGTLNRDRTQFDRAIEALERTLELRPGLEQARDLLIHCLGRAGRYEEAVRIGERTIAEGRASAATYDALGRLLHTRRGDFAARDNPLYDFERGIRFLEQAVEDCPGSPDPALVQYLKECYQQRPER